MEKQIGLAGAPEAASHAARLPYAAPELVEMGTIADATLSNGNDNGADGSYS